MNRILNTILHYAYIALNAIILLLLYVLLPFIPKPKQRKGILALAYTPQDWAGSYDRMHAWELLFQNDAIKYDIQYPWTAADLNLFNLSANKPFTRYSIYAKLLFSRLKIIFRIPQYEFIWVHRAFIPAFPYKDAYFEKFLSKLHPKVMYDFYDADYASNYNLVMNTVKLAYKVTVGTAYLKEKFLPINLHTYELKYVISTKDFKAKTNQQNTKIKIGWMGSPANAKNLPLIESQLQQIEQAFPQVEFSFVCRDLPALNLKNLQVHAWGKDNFDYYEWLSTIGIGIVPFLNPDERTKAKISMKGLEFMAQAVPMICSPYIYCDQLKVQEDFLLAQSNDWYDKLSELIQNESKRIEMGKAAHKVFTEHHSYPAVYRVFNHILYA